MRYGTRQTAGIAHDPTHLAAGAERAAEDVREHAAVELARRRLAARRCTATTDSGSGQPSSSSL